MTMSTNYYVYILHCADNTLYTGITNDLDRRLKMHNNKKASKYTRGRTPVEYVYTEKVIDKSTALKREYEIKRLSRDKKEKMILEYKKTSRLNLEV